MRLPVFRPPLELGGLRIRRRSFLELLSVFLLPGCGTADRAEAAPVDVEDPPPPEPLTEHRAEDTGSSTQAGTSLFLLGVASGDPLHDRVLLWTRLVEDRFAPDGGLPPIDIQVEWVVARDPDLHNVVRRGAATARSVDAHTVRADVDGLEPSTTYYYAFRHEGVASPVGRTRTLPAPDARVDKIRFAIAACQNWQEGFYTAHAHLAEEDIDFVLFLGDYIYEEGIDSKALRTHESNPPRTLHEYRCRHAQYKTDPNLQAAHAAHPWIAIWDDHEVAGNYAAQFDPAGLSPAAFLDRRAAAYKAYWEHIPVRADAPSGPNMQLYRQFEIGDLAHLSMLDGRQYRSKPPCDGKIRRGCEGRDAPGLSMLGDAQEKWLLDALSAARKKWKLIGNNVMMAPMEFASITNNDQWDGFLGERQRLLDAFATASDVVVLTGDLHTTLMCELFENPNDPSSNKVGVEIVTTSISSSNVAGRIDLINHATHGLPHVKYVNEKERGYIVCELTPERLSIALRGVSTVREEKATIRTVARWEILRGTSLVTDVR
jgi:alkaline phosphatase D